jgi:UDP-3-O-[3-hydroxymyristoyl] glucosamine N-acyltransferase
VSASYRLDELARRLGGKVVGDGSIEVFRLATLSTATDGDLSFLTNPRYRAQAQESDASALLVAPGVELPGATLLVVPKPYPALAELLELLYPQAPQPTGVDRQARVSPSAELAEGVHVAPFAVIGDGSRLEAGVRIGAGAVVGDRCRIGAGSEIMPRAVLYAETEIGRDCLIHAGAVIGADGFGFATSSGVHRKLRQVGRVRIEEGVEIGANSCVDRAMLGETVIGKGSKLDDLVMVAHGVQLGAGSLLAAQSGIAGSAVSGEYLTLAGQAGVAGHLTLGRQVTVAAKSAVFQDQPDAAFVAGVPAVDHRSWKRSQVATRRLPELRRQISRLESRIAALESKLEGEA